MLKRGSIPKELGFYKFKKMLGKNYYIEISLNQDEELWIPVAGSKVGDTDPELELNKFCYQKFHIIFISKISKINEIPPYVGMIKTLYSIRYYPEEEKIKFFDYIEIGNKKDGCFLDMNMKEIFEYIKNKEWKYNNK